MRRLLKFNVLKLSLDLSRSETVLRCWHRLQDFRTHAAYLQSWNDPAPAESRKPKGPPTVTGVDQRSRIRDPSRLNIVAGCMGESVRLAGVQVVKPKVPVTAIELAIGQPATVWRRGWISGLIDTERSNVSRLIRGE